MAGICESGRDAAVRFSRQVITDECRSLSEHPPEGPNERIEIKENPQRNRLKGLSPEIPQVFNAMQNKNGGVTTSPDEIADILKEHWGGVKREVKLAALRIWIERFPEHGERKWCIKKMSVVKDN